MRWGLLSFVVCIAASLAAFGVPASAATSAPLTAQGVLILAPGADPIGMPAARIAGDASVAAPRWRSSAVAPAVRVQRSWSVVTAGQAGSSARVVLRGVRLFDGALRLRGLRLEVTQPVTGDAVVDLHASGLVVDGAAVRVPASGDQPLPLGDWGVLSAAPRLDTGVAGLRIQIIADHGGLVAGSEIDLGLAAVPAPQDPPGGSGGPPPPTTGGHHTHHHRRHTHHSRHRRRHHHRPPPAPARPSRHRHRHRVAVPHPLHLPDLGHGVRSRIVHAAARQIGWPYVWGGESRKEGGFDCSGLVDYAYSAAGRPLPGRPTAAVLWRMGVPIARRNLRPGDLVFLGTHSGKPYHVAMYAGDGTVIVASGRNQPIASEPLDAVAWDGYARIWAPGGLVVTRSQHQPAAVSDPGDLVASRRVAEHRLTTAPEPAMAGLVRQPSAVPSSPRPSPRPRRAPEPRAQAALPAPDPRLRPGAARAVFPRPSA